MNIEFTDNGWDDFEYWMDVDNEMVEQIKELIKDIRKTPFQGLGSQNH